MNWETVIGLETHVELATKSKIFCACTTAFGGAPNTHCCPVCTGMPGALPVLNGKVVEYAVRAALALGCTVTRYSRFDRKNYFYPDLPKAYQISQLYLPIGRDGAVEAYQQEAPTGRMRKYYRLTRRGAAVLREEAAAWQTYSGAVNAVLWACPGLDPA